MSSLAAGRSAIGVAAGMVVLATCSFAVGDVVGKLLAHELSAAQLVWSRYAFALPIILLATRPGAWPGLLRVQRPWLQIGRATLPVAASFAFVLALRWLPLAEAASISFAAPILVVAFSTLVTGEAPTRRHWIGVGLGFLGVLVVVRPGANALAFAAIFPLIGAVCFALFQLLTRVVRHDPPATTLAWTLGAGLLMTTPLALLDWQPMDGRACAMSVASGIGFGLAQYLLTRAFQLAPAAAITPFTYAQIVPALVCDLAIFGIVPDPVSLIGTGLVIGAGLYALGPGRPGPARPSTDLAH